MKAKLFRPASMIAVQTGRKPWSLLRPTEMSASPPHSSAIKMSIGSRTYTKSAALSDMLAPFVAIRQRSDIDETGDRRGRAWASRVHVATLGSAQENVWLSKAAPQQRIPLGTAAIEWGDLSIGRATSRNSDRPRRELPALDQRDSHRGVIKLRHSTQHSAQKLCKIRKNVRLDCRSSNDNSVKSCRQPPSLRT